MDLLDLPPEIFTRVITHLVTGAGITEAWKCRNVCRTFRRSIEFETFGNQPIRAFLRTSDGRARTLLRKNTALYLRYRSTAEKNAYSFLPRFVNRMADFVCSTTLDHDHQTRKRYIRVICALLVQEQKRHGPSMRPLNGLIETKDPEASSRFADEVAHYNQDIASNYVAAAAAVGNLDVLRLALKDHPDDIWEPSPVFGYPLVAAAAGQQLTTVRAIVKHFEVSQQRTRMSQHQRRFSIAVDAAFEAKDEGIALLLLRVLHAYGSTINSDHFKQWTDAAICMRSSDLIHQARIMREDGTASHMSNSFRAACHEGDLNAVRMFLREGFVPLHCITGGYGRGGTPLTIAVISSKPAIVKMILKMGANPNGDWVLSPHDRPLWEAIQHNSESMVQLLLRYGADPEFIKKAWEKETNAFRLSRRSKIKTLLARAWKKDNYFVFPSEPRTKFAIDAPDLAVSRQTDESHAEG